MSEVPLQGFIEEFDDLDLEVQLQLLTATVQPLLLLRYYSRDTQSL